MTFIFFQRGATGYGFQIGRLYWQINYFRFWFLWRVSPFSGRKTFEPSIGHWGWDDEADESNGDE